jgi:hypothetical protein
MSMTVRISTHAASTITPREPAATIIIPALSIDVSPPNAVNEPKITTGSAITQTAIDSAVSSISTGSVFANIHA